MAHAMEVRGYFQFHTKDIHSKGLAGNYDFPDASSFDIPVNVTLTRNYSKNQPEKDFLAEEIKKLYFR